MISQTQHTEVNTLSNQSGVFTIKNSAKMFHLLISGLYSNKIQSITREIWSNALDAHAQAGCTDRPFDVSFPHTFDPTFRVRDYGVSLTHEQVMNLYTTVGESTKEDSNEFVGKWGLGSKSPFAYTDNFTVTVMLGGEKRLYSAVIGGDGVPMIHLMGTEPTDEENGVEVSFPVEKADVRAFTDAARRVSHGFKVKPNVINNPSFAGWPTLPVIAEGEGWTLVRGAIDGYREQCYARMGCVLYPIDREALGQITAEQREILNATFLLDFDMGELEMTPSREDLQYGRTQPTAAAILNKIDGLMTKLTDKALADYAKCGSYFEAATKYTADVRSPSMPNVLKNILKKKAVWQGRALNTTISTPIYHGLQMSLLTESMLRRKAYRFTPTNSVTIEANAKTIIFVEDLTGDKKVVKAAQRLNDFIARNFGKYEQVLWVRVYGAKAMQTEMVSLMEVFDGAVFELVENLPEPPKALRAARRPVQARQLGSRGFSDMLMMTEEDFEAGGIYVRLERMEPIVPVNMVSPARMLTLLRAAGALTEKDIVVGAPKSMWNQFDEDQWENLYDYAARWLTAQNVDITAMQARRNALTEILGDDAIRYLCNHVEEANLAPTSPARAAIELYQAARGETVPQVRYIQELAAALNTVCTSGDNEPDAYKAQYDVATEQLSETYPLLDALRQTYGRITVDMVTSYVIMCDNVSLNDQTDLRIAA